MKNWKSKLSLLFIYFVLIIAISCKKNDLESKDAFEIQKWKLGWRLINSSWDKNYELGEQQFDSLLKLDGPIETKFVVTGLEVLFELGKKEKLIGILSKQDLKTLDDICNKELFTKKLTDIPLCESKITAEHIGNVELQTELIKMYLNDQSVRGNVMHDIISNYNLEEYELTKMDAVITDQINRDRLKEIIEELGFPTKKLVGKDAMQAVFIIIQHSDGDTEWQKQQLLNIKRAVKQGDMDGQSYAYLYDRIKINGGEKQLYGTQFQNVDLINKKVELADTEDIENLDRRRMEVGMMPMQMYEQLMLKNLPQ